MANFEKGDEVILYAVGLKMTIDEIGYSTDQKILYVECIWESKKRKGKFHRERFSPGELVHLHKTP
jgi:uncharacterized protein YodC (DUF2158 family)